ncbi:extracellular solute-binding protein [Globicatella sp. PHS-GS-PNBC-21-1553]|uniref:extracellular solute-binding protein n=1 Tax=Globicatella sp. PHS-GS-PNBC-21-1553 TaxID=2885764 RepID=UPI00298F2B0E|nr:extracellular solute-binding protein [Globicatella sp. PHS-GS-PNBC-21-1553]WPC07870.1 extracellular solute-binding protein [Globicatella sp. PHS-GS-PNBC-21-1553]
MKKFIKKAIVSILTLSAISPLTGVGHAQEGPLEVAVAPDFYPFFTEIGNRFAEENGIEVKVIEVDEAQALEALTLDGPAGLGHDVYIAPFNDSVKIGIQGHGAEVTLPEDGRFDDTDKKQVTYQDKIYGYPLAIETLVMYYNTELLDKAPTTFEELETLSKDEKFAFSGEEGKSVAFLANWLDFYHAFGLISGFGGYIFGEENTNPEDIGLNNEGAIEAVTYGAKWYNEIWPEGMKDSSSSLNFLNEQFINGTAAAVINGPWQFANYKEAGVPFEVAPIPSLPNGKPYSPFAGGKALVVSNYSKQKEMAVKFLDFATNEENQLLMHNEFTAGVPANAFAKEKITSDAKNVLSMTVIEQYKSSIPMPNIIEMSEVWEPAGIMMFEAGSGNKTPEEATNEAVELIKEQIMLKY